MRPIGLVELARIAEVSVATASRALANNPRVALATRERLQRLGQEHGFRLNQAASLLRKQRTQAIGVVVPLGHETGQSLADPFFVGLIGPLADALSAAGYDLLLSRVIPDRDTWLDDLVDSGRVDGVIVIGQSNQLETIERVSARYRRIVVWGANVPHAEEVSVGTDNVAGGALAARHLMSVGRKRLAFVGNPVIPEFQARYSGFRSAIAEFPDVTEIALNVHLTTERSYHEMAAFLDANPPPDGIFAASDVIAMSTIRAITEFGMRVPQDVSVVGYDDVSIARHTAPPLTTIRQDVVHGAQLLVDLLIKRIAGEPAQSVMMLPELVVRGSA